MKLTDSFFLKNRLAVMKIARDMVIVQSGSKISTITEYAEKFNISRGTVQNAITYLCEKGAIEIQRKGHQGTILLDKDPDKIWGYTGWGLLTGVMNLPLNLLASGLATGICECMKTNHINFNCIFIQGSKTRIDALASNKYDFVIASNLTASIMQENYPGLEQVVWLDDCYYAGKYVLLFSTKEYTGVEDGMTIAVDPTSIDQLYLTNAVCKGKNVKRKELTYINTSKSVAMGEADVVVSRLDIVNELYADMHYMDVTLPGFTEDEIRDFSKAVVLASKDNYGLNELLQQVLNNKQIADIQGQVMNHQMFPSYY